MYTTALAQDNVVVIPLHSNKTAGTDGQIQYNDAGKSGGAEVYYNKNTENVGIGATSPDFKLDVNGSIKVRNSAIYFGNDVSHQWTIGPQVADSYVIYANGAAGYVMVLNRISGNVGIGTTSPQGKLDVNGAIYQRGGQLHADYVFDPKYTLESIEEHAEFMWQKQHLTAVPKAKYDENGLEVLEIGSHRKGMLEELEKAHIYIDQLNSNAKMQNAQIAALKTLVCQDHPTAKACM